MCNKPFSNLNPYLSHLSVSGTVKRVVGTMSINSKSHTPVYYFTKKNTTNQGTLPKRFLVSHLKSSVEVFLFVFQ